MIKICAPNVLGGSMRVIIQFSDFQDFEHRTNPGDVLVIGREENGKIESKERWYAEPNNRGGYQWIINS